LRNIAQRVSISYTALFRHKNHVAGTIAKAQARREESIGDSIFEEMRRLLEKGRELLQKFEAEGDTRGAIVAVRELRATLEAMDTMQSRVDEVKQGQIVVNITRDRATPAICLPERPALDVPGRVVQPEKPLRSPPEEASERILGEPENVAQHRDNYLRALRDVSGAVQPAPVPPWAR
jgi:hypothetical protein